MKKCIKCGSSDTWQDDDLHWIWCNNSKCPEHFGGNAKTNEWRIYLAQYRRDMMQETDEPELDQLC